MRKLYFGKQSWLPERRPARVGCLIAGILITLYLGGLIAQCTSSNMFTSEASLSFNPITAIAANFVVGLQGLICILILYACIGIYLYIRHQDKTHRDLEDDERGFQTDNSGVYGTAALLQPNEVKAYAEVEPLEKTTGLIVGKFQTSSTKKGCSQIVSIPPDGKRFKYDALGLPVMQKLPQGGMVQAREKLNINGNRHAMVIGPTGSGKSYCFARPAIFQSINQGESIIVTDPKGELFSDTSEYARQHGYIVRILNLAYPQGSDSWDALAEVKGGQIGIEAQNFCNIIIENTSNPSARGDEVYSNGEKNLLTALVLYVLTAPTYTGDKTLGGVYELLCKEEDELESIFDMLPSNNIARGPWNIFKTASPALRGNLKLGLGVRLQVMQDEVIKNVTGVPEIDLTQPGKSKCAYYVIMSDMHSTFQFISSLFFSCLFNRLVEFSRMQPGLVLPIAVNVIMDEFIAIGRLPDFDKKLATVRSAHINISMIFQTLAQLQEAYPNGLWETLIANCSTLLCLSCNDLTTAKYLSDRSGTATVALDNTRVDRPVLQLGQVPTNISHSYSVGRRAVLSLDEIVRLASHNVLVSITSANLFIADKFPYTDMINDSDLIRVNMYDHVPMWIEQMRYAPTPQQPAVENLGYQPRKRKNDNIPPATTPPLLPPTDANNQPPSAASQSPPKVQVNTDDDICDGDDITTACAPSLSNIKPPSQASQADETRGSYVLKDF